MGRYQKLGLPTGAVIFIIGVWLILVTHHPSNLHYTGLSFAFVGPAMFIVALMSWLSDRYDRLSWLIAGLVVAGMLFLVGVAMALASYFY